MKKKRNVVEWAMHYRQIVILITCCLVAFGIYSLPNMRKNEFPDYTIRQGIVVAVAPGTTAEQMIERVTKPLENFIFTYKEVKKWKTHSKTQDGLTYIQVELNDNVTDKDEFWSKFKHGVADFKSSLPSNVLAIKVMDDFGDTSALLITMESKDKTYRELHDYMDELQDRLRTIPSVGRLSESGMLKEQISVYLDNDKLSQYGLSDKTLALSLVQKGFTTTAGRLKTPGYTMPVYVGESLNTVYDIEQLIVFTSPTGKNVRLKDVARIVREYPKADSYITNNGKKCLLLSVEMKKGENVVDMGNEIKKVIDEYQKELPSDVSIYKITDQSKVVGDSVNTFLRELLIAIVAVVIVVVLLLPLRTALVAASTIPITIFISLGLFYAFGIELNTVTLAALITTLGMIVDNSIVIIDNYLELLGEGNSRWNASIKSTTHFFKSIASATAAISITFFPFLITTSGMINDFLQSFPWAITIVLVISLMVATLLVPFMQFFFIRKPMKVKTKADGEKSFSFLDLLQKYYNWLLDRCLAHPVVTLCTGVASIIIGVMMFSGVNQQLMPAADRNQFAVEIYLPAGTPIERTVAVADSMEQMLGKDERVLSVTSFKGCSSPRFHTAYAPQMAGTNYAQFIVNTKGIEETEQLLDDYADKYTNYFSEAKVRFKQLSYSEAARPVEVRLSGSDPAALKHDALRIQQILKTIPYLKMVDIDLNEPVASANILLKEDEASRLGVTNLGVESTLSLRYGDGMSMASVWEGDYDVAVKLKSLRSDSADINSLANEQIPVMGGLKSIPLRQVANIQPQWSDGQIARRNGVRTVTVYADLVRGANGTAQNKVVAERLDTLQLSKGVKQSYGGDVQDTEEKLPPILGGLAVAAVMIFFILLAHFRKISIASLIFVSMALCMFGTAVGLTVQGVDFSITCVLGVVSLMGIIVRNGIIMIDYAEELREKEGMYVSEAIYHSARRRMRPIFLTSAAASMGVVPMILGGSGLWMPMGTVIFYGTIITMFFILTMLPVGYLLIMRGSTKRRAMAEKMEKEE